MVDQTTSNHIHIDLSAYLIESGGVYWRVSVPFRYLRMQQKWHSWHKPSVAVGQSGL
jgi:hypothetical protein